MDDPRFNAQIEETALQFNTVGDFMVKAILSNNGIIDLNKIIQGGDYG